MAMKVKYQHDSRWETRADIPDFRTSGDPRQSKDMKGAYTHPVLDTLLLLGATYYVVTAILLPEKIQQLREIRKYVDELKDLVLSYVEGDKLVLVQSDKRLTSELGISIQAGGKTVKRMKTITRAFMLQTRRPAINVMVMPSKVALDGWFVISRRLYHEMVENMSFPIWDPASQAQVRMSMDKKLIHNGRIMGNLINVHTGEAFEGFIKGNCAVVDYMPEGVDVITTEDNIKSEVYGGKYAWALLEPQGAKKAFTDQQSLVNNPFFLSVPRARAYTHDFLKKSFKEVTEGVIHADVMDLTKASFNKDFNYDVSKLNAEMRWTAMKLAAYGVDYRVSLFVTEQLANQAVQKLAVEDQKRTRVPLPCAIRAQVISESAARLAGWVGVVSDGHSRWDDKLQVEIVSDHDWYNIDDDDFEWGIVPTHGGCDLDDFFTIMQVEDEFKLNILGAEAKVALPCILRYRNPISRGEFSISLFTPGDKVFKYQMMDGKEISFPPVKYVKRPEYILFALKAGRVAYATLPSQEEDAVDDTPHAYGKRDVIRALEESLSLVGVSYGAFELAFRAWNSLSLTAQLPLQIPSETAIDAFVQGGSAADRQFIFQFKDLLIEQIKASGKPVDALLVGRLGDDSIPGTDRGVVSRIHNMQQAEAKAYTAKVRAFTTAQDIPEWLKELGKNPYFNFAKSTLLNARRTHAVTDSRLRAQGVDWKNVGQKVVREEVDKVLSAFWNKDRTPVQSAQFAMAFWLANRMIPTKTTQRITDQMVFGTMMFDKVMEAMVFYGIAHKPQVDKRGHVYRKELVSYTGNKQWTLTCANCGTVFQDRAEIGLIRFWESNSFCKNCVQ